jgi:hypothetical protein
MRTLNIVAAGLFSSGALAVPAPQVMTPVSKGKGGLGPLLDLLGIGVQPLGVEAPRPPIQGWDLRFLADIFKVPNLEKYVDSYLDWRNMSTIPFLGPMAMGPVAIGCNKYELLIGK